MGLEEVEVLGEQGQVGKALEEFLKVRRLKVEKDEKEVSGYDSGRELLGRARDEMLMLTQTTARA